jgi:hypothetical protein
MRALRFRTWRRVPAPSCRPTHQVQELAIESIREAVPGLIASGVQRHVPPMIDEVRGRAGARSASGCALSMYGAGHLGYQARQRQSRITFWHRPDRSVSTVPNPTPPPCLQALEARCSELHREVAAQGALLAGDLGRLAREAGLARSEVAAASNLAKKVGGWTAAWWRRRTHACVASCIYGIDRPVYLRGVDGMPERRGPHRRCMQQQALWSRQPRVDEAGLPSAGH